MYPYSEPAEYTDVVFEGVMGNDIIFDVQESAVALIENWFSDTIKRLEKQAWGILMAPGAVCEAVREQGLKVYGITASYGMEGFVICRSMQFRKPV
jgi:fatty acid/phospholipid biosynthesis enzyme